MEASTKAVIEIVHELKSFVCLRLCSKISDAELQTARKRLLADYLSIVGSNGAMASSTPGEVEGFRQA